MECKWPTYNKYYICKLRLKLEPWYTITLATFNSPFRLNLTHFWTTLLQQKLEQLGPALTAHPKQMQPKELAVIIMNIKNSINVKLKHMSVHLSWRSLEWKQLMVRSHNNKKWVIRKINNCFIMIDCFFILVPESLHSLAVPLYLLNNLEYHTH